MQSNKLKEIVEKNELSDYTQLAAELLEKFDATDIVAAAIKSLTREPDDTPVSISEERPLPMRRVVDSNVIVVVIKEIVAEAVHWWTSSGGGRGYEAVADPVVVAIVVAEAVAVAVRKQKAAAVHATI